ncbi:MAG: 30S ribosomal protein S8 [Candidatus Bipolaricaulota bacterium]|nr:30S ribosomal protein S8 [Candidatus Bipolaricaulota bacterium]MCS7275060.1 30S ribosomal protein S8 [Candidatus Bipolaricaulota bacterium]MDW8110388.1 30S ribosomal protein S8 [Candidatus Bipolaricaulota bacterium]MDW8329541.1 30S ribosomal protein S8 [Candidatus Bipolaricaulota bacterium]
MDPIANMLTAIRNANQRRLRETRVPFSRLKAEILRILQEEGFIQEYRVEGDEKKRDLVIVLKYKGKRGKDPVLEGIERVSKPGRRVYVGVHEIPRVRSGLGVAILSTPQGVLTGKAARRARVGGELLLRVW